MNEASFVAVFKEDRRSRMKQVLERHHQTDSVYNVGAVGSIPAFYLSPCRFCSVQS